VNIVAPAQSQSGERHARCAASACGIRAPAGSRRKTPQGEATVGLLLGARVTPFRQGYGETSTSPRRHRLRDAAKIEALTHGLIKDGTSLFCSRQTLVQNGAPLTYFFADGKHPTTLGHLIIARFVLIEVWKQGLL
jgi:hypothetical protein